MQKYHSKMSYRLGLIKNDFSYDFNPLLKSFRSKSSVNHFMLQLVKLFQEFT